MKTKLSSSLIVALLALSTLTPNAAPITGDFAFSGGVTLDAPAFAATQVSSFGSTTVAGTPAPTGDFATFVSVGDPVGMTATPWPFAASSLGLWAVDGFVFDLLAGSTVTHAGTAISGAVVVIGTGVISGNGFDPTPGEFVFSANNARSSFSFSASASATPAPLPEAGSTLGMLGIALGACGWRARKLLYV